jgi:DNA-binding MarR family transcriptional regulator
MYGGILAVSSDNPYKGTPLSTLRTALYWTFSTFPSRISLDAANKVATIVGVTASVENDTAQTAVQWLTPDELSSWLSVVKLMTWLPWSIDQQLQRDAGLATVEYQVLACLSQSPQCMMRMSSMAVLTNASLSRLSRVVKRLEDRGLVRREADPSDGRFTNAILTDEGFRTIEAAAPAHVAHVRSLVIDVLSAEQLRRLGIAAERILSRIDTTSTVT